MKKRKALSLSDQLRHEVAQSHMTAYELGEKAKVDRSVLSRFLGGKRTITLETADRLAEALRLRITRA